MNPWTPPRRYRFTRTDRRRLAEIKAAHKAAFANIKDGPLRSLDFIVGTILESLDDARGAAELKTAVDDAAATLTFLWGREKEREQKAAEPSPAADTKPLDTRPTADVIDLAEARRKRGRR